MKLRLNVITTRISCKTYINKIEIRTKSIRTLKQFHWNEGENETKKKKERI